MTDTTPPTQPSLTLLPGTPTVEQLADLYFLLTGRYPSPEELKQARLAVDGNYPRPST